MIGGFIADVLVFAFAIGVVVGIIVGGLLFDVSWQREAIAHGAATWEVDERGNVTFEWLPAAEPTE